MKGMGSGWSWQTCQLYTSVCFYHLRRLRQIRNYVSQSLTISHGTTCDVTRHHTHWLLQLNPCRFTCIQTGATATSAKRGRSTGAEFASTSAHQSCTKTAALASGHASRHVQDSHIDAPQHQIVHKRCPSYLADLVTFNTTTHRDVTSDLQLQDPPPYDAHELKAGTHYTRTPS